MTEHLRNKGASKRTPKRRRRGDGSIYRRSDGRWVGRVTHQGERRSYYGRTRAEAEQKLRIAQAITNRWGAFPDLTATVATVIESYRNAGKHPSHWQVPRANVDDHLTTIKTGLGTHLIAFLTADQVRDDFLEPLSESVDRDTFWEVFSTLDHLLDHSLRGFAPRHAAPNRDVLPKRYKSH